MNDLTPKLIFIEPIRQLRAIAMEQISSHGRAAVLGKDLDKLVKQGSGRSFVLLSFTSDFLRLLSMCLLADRRLSPAEVQFLFPLVGPASKLYARYRETYRQVGDINRGNVHEFLKQYNDDSDLFGFRCPLTRWGGIAIVNNISAACGSTAAMELAKTAYGRLGDALRSVSGGGIEIDRILENVEDNFTPEGNVVSDELDFEVGQDDEWDLADFQT